MNSWKKDFKPGQKKPDEHVYVIPMHYILLFPALVFGDLFPQTSLLIAIHMLEVYTVLRHSVLISKTVKGLKYKAQHLSGAFSKGPIPIWITVGLFLTSLDVSAVLIDEELYSFFMV